VDVREIIEDYLDEYARYRAIGEKALEQMPDAALNRRFGEDGNSAAVIVRHISGNFLSRFTDFMTADGEKPWRKRDEEFEVRDFTRKEMNERWREGWAVLEKEAGALSDADLGKNVHIRGKALTVNEAIARSLAHVAYHVGQLVVLARINCKTEWKWISIPRGKSEQYNQNPTLERRMAK
jgi:Protein of unknown function (DUF1572)